MNDDAPFTFGGCLFVALIILVSLLCVPMGACNISDADATRTLQHEGVTNVQLHGYAWFECSRDDIFSVKFQGNKNGFPVEGALCSGGFKDITVRYK